MKARVHDAAIVIQLDGDFGMALDAGYGVNDNSLCHKNRYIGSTKLDVFAGQMHALAGQHLFQNGSDAGGGRRTAGQ